VVKYLNFGSPLLPQLRICHYPSIDRIICNECTADLAGTPEANRIEVPQAEIS